MKKLLAMYICVSAFLYGFDTKASGLDMPPLDNALMPLSFVLELVSDDSSSYQMAGIYHIVDYSKKMESYYGKRVNDDGKSAQNSDCAIYGLFGPSGCSYPKVVSDPVIVRQGLVCYKRCKCSSEYVLTSCPTGTNVDCRDSCDGKYKKGDCLQDYKMSDKGTCVPLSCAEKGGYDTCPGGYGVASYYSTNAGVHCVTCEQCVAGMYSKGTGACVACACGTYSKAGAASCTPCASGTYQPEKGKYSCKSLDHPDGWTISSDKCSVTKKSCPTGYTAGVTNCSSWVYSWKGYSGDDVCGKCTPQNDDCPTGYGKTACTSTQKQVGTTITEAGTKCYKCEDLPICPTGQVEVETYWCKVPSTNCSSMGYTKTSAECNGKEIVKCPFDLSKIYCL